MDKAIFLDRDGIVNIDYGYVHKKEKFVFEKGIFELVNCAISLSYKIFIITNQSGIGRGLFSEKEFLELNKWMLNCFFQKNLIIDKVYYCPHHPEEAINKYRKKCFCRKPQPGMIFQARDEFNLNLRNSILVGDSICDIDAGINAGIGMLLFRNKMRYKRSIRIENNFDVIKYL